RVGWPGATIDDAGAGFTTPTGTWVRLAATPGSKDFQGSRTYANRTPTPGTATATARWTFTVEPGTYRVMTSFQGTARAATNAPFNVYDNTTRLTATSVRVNQRTTPSDLKDAGRGWKALGFFKVASKTLAVGLSNNANGRVIADAVRVERVNAPTAPS